MFFFRYGHLLSFFSYLKRNEVISNIRRNPVSKGLAFLLLWCLGVQSLAYAVQPVLLSFGQESLGAVEVYENYAAPNGQDLNKAKVRFVDPKGNPLAGVDIKWSVTGGDGVEAVEIIDYQRTDDEGYSYVSLKSTESGLYRLHASWGGQEQEGLITFSKYQFKGDIKTPEGKQYVAKPVQVSVKLLGSKRPMEGIQPTWQVQGGSVVKSTPTNEKGIATATIKASRTGEVFVTVTAPDSQSKRRPMIFDSEYSLKVAKIPVSTNVTSPATVVVKLMKGTEPARGETVKWEVIGSEVDILKESIKGDDNGLSGIAIKSKQAENVTVKAIAPNGLILENTVSFTSQFSMDTIVAPLTPAPVGKPVHVSVKLKRSDHVQQSTKLKWSVSGVGSSITKQDNRTNREGIASATARFTKAGVFNIKVATPDGTNHLIKVQVGHSYDFKVMAQPTVTKPGDLAWVTMKVEEYGRVKKGIQINWKRLEGEGSLGATGSTTDQDGMVSVSVKKDEAGTVKLVAVAPDGIESDPIPVTFGTGAHFAGPVTFPSTPNGLGVNIPTPVTVKVMENGEFKAGVEVVWQVSNGGHLDQLISLTDGDGLAENTVTASEEGYLQVTVTTSGESVTGEASFHKDYYEFEGEMGTPSGTQENTDSTRVSVRVLKDRQAEEGIKVKWSVNGELVESTETEEVSDKKGYAYFYIPTGLAGNITVRATTPDGNFQEGVVYFEYPSLSYKHAVIWNEQ